MQDTNHDASQPGPVDGQRLVPVSNNAPAVGGLYGVPGYPGSVYSDGESDLAATLQQYIRLVLKRKWLIISVVLTFFILGGVITLMKTPRYSSTVRIQIELQSAKVFEGGDIAPRESGRGDFLRTQFELLKSRTMAERVVSALQLHTDEDFLKPKDISLFSLFRGLLSEPERVETKKSSELQALAASIVGSQISIRPVRGSRLVDLTYKDTSPQRAQQIANAYADAFVASNLDKRFEANQYAKTFLEDQIKQLKLRLEESEKALLAFAEREQIIQVSEKTSIAENNLSAANVALGKLISQRIKNEQLWRQVENATAINLPQLLSNSVIDGLRARLNTLTTEFQEKLETFKPSYPAMVQISNKIKEIKRQLSVEVDTIRGSLKAAYESSKNQETQMKKQIKELRAEVLSLQKRGVQHNILKREVDINRKLYHDLLQRYKEVDIAGGVGTNNVFIVDRAQIPKVPSEPRLARALLLSLALGLGAGLGLAYVLEILDDRIRAPEDIEQLSGLATLGIIPNTDSTKSFKEALNDPRSAIAEAYRSLGTALQFATESGLPKSITVTSAGSGEGKSSTALALARHFATMGLKVLLVDADLRNPSLHEKLGQDNAVGLSNYLTGSASPPEVIQETDQPNLALMASGPLPANAADLLGGTRIYSLVSVGLQVFDLIVIDSPPLLGLADAQLLSSAVSATVFVVGAGQHRKGMIQSGLRRLELARSTPIGVVLTKFDSKAVGYGYGYGYGGETYSYGNPGEQIDTRTGQKWLAKSDAS